MVNRIADRLLNAVLPQKKAAAPCGPVISRPCGCSGGLRRYQNCQDCTGASPGCGPCYVVGTC